jgi:hypothetical protein
MGGKARLDQVARSGERKEKVERGKAWRSGQDRERVARTEQCALNRMHLSLLGCEGIKLDRWAARASMV